MQRKKAVKRIVLFIITICVMRLPIACSIEQRFCDKKDCTIIMAGSTSMEKLTIALAESLMDKYPYMTVTTEFTGSSAGIEAMLAGSVQIGNSSRALTKQEQSAGAVGNVVAVEGIVVITDTANSVTALTMEQLTDIYAGRIRNWSELGGADVPIVVVGREAGSGTRETFEELLGMKDKCSYANELDSTGAVMARVAVTPGAIGYISRDVLNDTVQVLSIDGYMPTDHNILEGRYPLSRPFIMATKGDITVQGKGVQLLFAYLYSAEGKRLIESVGLIVPGPEVVQ